MPFASLAEGTHHCQVDCPGVDRAVLSRYLEVEERPVAALLNRQKMTLQAPGRFLYRSRPFRLLRYEVRPEIQFDAFWSKDALEISFNHCRIEGLGAIEQAIRFECEASLRPVEEGIHAVAWASVLMEDSHPVAVVPRQLRKSLAEQALQRVFRRLERRCQGGLRRSLQRWAGSSGCSGRGSVRHG